MKKCVATLLFTTLLVPFLGFAESDEEALFLRRIADFWQEGEYLIAKNQMEEFISEYPENHYSDPLSAALGDLYLREKNFAKALDCYSHITDPEVLARIFLSKMQCLYEMQWYATLADECEAHLANGFDLHSTYFLAIALYHQCLNGAATAEKAKPLFEKLMQSELADEVAQGYAHLCFILKDYPKAASIYLTLAEDNPGAEEEMLFQAALIQSEYDKELAIQTFTQIASLGGKRAQDAAYNKLALSFDAGKFEELTSLKFEELPEERRSMARLFLGRSLLHLKKYPEAAQELKAYVAENEPSEAFYAALIGLIDAASQGGDLALLEETLATLKTHYPEDAELPKARFSKARLLKGQGKLNEARGELETILAEFPKFAEEPYVLSEIAHLDYEMGQWEGAIKTAKRLLTQFPEHELSIFAWRYRLSALTEWAEEKPQLRKELAAELQRFLTLPFSEEEKVSWRLVLSKTYYEMKDYDKAKALLGNTPNDRLLFAFCLRDGDKQIEEFAKMAEIALQEGAQLINSAEVHAALYNAYLQMSEPEKAADHLFAAFIGKTEIKAENLLWLANIYYQRMLADEMNEKLAQDTAILFEKIHRSLGKETCKLAKAYSLLHKDDEVIALLSQEKSADAEVLLAQSYAQKGMIEEALERYDAVIDSCGTMRSPAAATAALQRARLALTGKNPDLIKIAMQLKNIVLQKNLDGEPIYLEAALDYVDLQAKGNAEKRLRLLKKTKEDFEQAIDLLSQDYHAARKRLASKDALYQGYMQLIDAELFLLEKKPAAAKALLKGIVEHQKSAPLLLRARQLLGDEAKK